VKVIPSLNGLENYVMKLGATKAETAAVWASLPPLTGINILGTPKESAFVLAQSPRPATHGRPRYRKGRVLAFAGETWPWSRASDLTHDAHRKFWRQAILWLAHKETRATIKSASRSSHVVRRLARRSS